MRITKWGEYGILCSLLLASKTNDTESMSAAEIAEMQAIPLQYTHQILQRLRKGDIVKSLRGPKGGYQLSRSPETINVKEVLEASEGTTFEIICEAHPVYGEICGSEQVCALSGVWQELKSAIDEVLENRTLASLLETHRFYPGECRLSTEESLINIQSE